MQSHLCALLGPSIFRLIWLEHQPIRVPLDLPPKLLKNGARYIGSIPTPPRELSLAACGLRHGRHLLVPHGSLSRSWVLQYAHLMGFPDRGKSQDPGRCDFAAPVMATVGCLWLCIAV